MDLAIVEREVGFTSSNSKQQEEKEQQSEQNRSESRKCLYTTTRILYL